MIAAAGDTMSVGAIAVACIALIGCVASMFGASHYEELADGAAIRAERAADAARAAAESAYADRRHLTPIGAPDRPGDGNTEAVAPPPIVQCSAWTLPRDAGPHDYVRCNLVAGHPHASPTEHIGYLPQYVAGQHVTDRVIVWEA